MEGTVQENGTMTDDLYAFLLKIDNADLDIKNDALATGFKVLNYLNDTYDNNTTNTIMNGPDLLPVGFQRPDFFKPGYTQLQEGLGKILSQADTEITYNGPRKTGTARGTITLSSGNAVKGVDYIMPGI